MMDLFLFLLFSFGALYFGRPFCIYMGCIDIEYCMYDICDLWTALVVFGLWLWICIYGYVYGAMCLCLWI